MVVPNVRTLTALCPAVRTFREHLFLVIADDLRTVSGILAHMSGHRPRRQKAHSPAPIGSGDTGEGMLISSGIMRQSSGSQVERGLRASGRGKAEGQGAHVDLGLRSWLHSFHGLPRPIITVADEGAGALSVGSSDPDDRSRCAEHGRMGCARPTGDTHGLTTRGPAQRRGAQGEGRAQGGCPRSAAKSSIKAGAC
jgi:hypothetical protein